ncbi:hypothetical protein TSMEX_011215 [Taenia solium]
MLRHPPGTHCMDCRIHRSLAPPHYKKRTATHALQPAESSGPAA